MKLFSVAADKSFLSFRVLIANPYVARFTPLLRNTPKHRADPKYAINLYWLKRNLHEMRSGNEMKKEKKIMHIFQNCLRPLQPLADEGGFTLSTKYQSSNSQSADRIIYNIDPSHEMAFVCISAPASYLIAPDNL